MEATALSVGKAVLDGALGYAKSFVAEEIALQLGVERDVIFIGDELEMMQSFLMTADEEQDRHKVLLTWVKQVRETAYNVEDNLMAFAVHSEKKPICFYIPRNLWERRRIGKEVKELRAKVEDVSNRNLRYRLIKGSGSKPTTAAEEQANVATVAMMGINEANRTAMKLENSVIDFRQLITSEDKGRSVVAVWGATADLRTTAIQDVYDDPAVRANFGFRAWIKLAHPFIRKEFIQSLVRQYYENFPEAIGGTHKRRTIGVSVFMKMESMSQSEMLDVFDTKVSDNSYMIVVDDVSTKEQWDCIENYFPDNKKGSRVIVSTQQAEIARLCTGKEYLVSELKQLSYNQSLYLFHKKVMLSSNSSNENLEISSSEILEEDNQPKDEDGDKVFYLTSGKKFNRSRTMDQFDEILLLGRTTDKSRVIELVGQPHDGQGCKVISVWGMGGLGKTTLVQSVYRSPQLGNWKRAWATALRPFNPEQLIRKLAGDLGVATNGEFKDLTETLTQKLKQERCLIVLDDISSTTEWDFVGNCLKNAMRIIITTREKSIAKHCSKEVINMHNLSGLEDDVALDLFKRKVFKDDFEKNKISPDMTEQARLIIKKCDGLPLAISTIGGFLATKPKTSTEWRKTYDRINTELEINQELRAIKTVLLRSYDGLPYHLKSCFLYFSIFPEDHKIRRKPLIRRWVAEGYAREMHGMTAEEVGDMYFEQLLDRSMILPGGDVNIYSGKFDSCQLHDIMRQICISKAREENLAFTLEDGCSFSSTQGTTRHLAISSNWNRYEQDFIQTMVDLSHVRSLTVFKAWRSFYIYKKMRFLRVMDLEGTQEVRGHQLNGIGEFIHLKFLSLKCCPGIHNLPNSLGKLSNLQILDIRGTCARELPANVTNLQKLQFLRAHRVLVPRGIGKLNALCTLAHVELYEKGQGAVKELAQLHQLRKLGVEGNTKTNNKEFWSAIRSLNHLQSLSVSWYCRGSDNYKLDSPLGGSLLPPRSIESLKLDGPVVRLTEWIHQLQNLTRLLLRGTGLQQDAIQAVGKLPNLAILNMGIFSFKGEELIFEQGSFPSLVLLEFIQINDASSVKFEDGTMPKLEVLRIKLDASDGELQELSGLRYLTGLKEIQLDLWRCLEEKVINVLDQLVGHQNNVRVLRNDDY
ncbi:unnamed protein product [Urochloa decumbens]|uniref:Disease resistance protein RPM1 n=1 Tax=Urochloa decumbens TaxID=240449 RepID=A0ABC9BHT0_9POAL